MNKRGFSRKSPSFQWLRDHNQTLQRIKSSVHKPNPKVIAYLAAAVIALLLLLFLVLPVGLAAGSGFMHDGQLSSYWFGRVLGNVIIRRELLNGIVLATTTTAACLVIAVPMAILRGRTRFRGQAVCGILVLMPLILPPFVGALAMRRLFGQFGVINIMLSHLGLVDFTAQTLPPDWLGSGFAGVVILQTLHLFPIMYLNAAAALASVDPAYQEAARNLGAGSWRTFLKVTLPLMRPGLFAGGTIVFIWSFTDIGTPLMLGYERVAPVTIFKELARGDFSGRTYSLVFILLSVSLLLYVLGKFVLGRAYRAETSKASTGAEIRRLGPVGTLLAWLLFGGVVLLAVLPHIGVILTAISERWVGTVLPTAYTFRHLRFVIASESTYRSILNSLKYAGTATAVDAVIGCTIAWLLVRARIRGRTALDGLAMMPLAIPGLILAAGYVALTVRGSPLEALGPTRDPFIILVIAYSVRRLPFVVRGVSAGLDQVPESLEEAGRNLGAGRARVLFRITVPLMAASLIAALVLTFSFAMLEVSDSLILAQVQHDYPITKQIYTLAASTGSPDTLNDAAALGTYGMLLLAATLGISSALLGKRMGTIFRA
jgi:iron(III) transport system permease protein